MSEHLTESNEMQVEGQESADWSYGDVVGALVGRAFNQESIEQQLEDMPHMGD